MEAIFNYHLLSKIPESGTAFKAKPERIFAENFAEQVEESRMQIAEVLGRIKVEKILTAKEMSAIFGKHLSSWYRYINAELVLPSNVMMVLIRVLAEKGHTELLSLMLPAGFTIVKLPGTPKNGSIKDEFIRAVKDEALAVAHFEKSEYKKVVSCAGRAVTETLAIVGEAEEILSKGK